MQDVSGACVALNDQKKGENIVIVLYYAETSVTIIIIEKFIMFFARKRPFKV